MQHSGFYQRQKKNLQTDKKEPFNIIFIILLQQRLALVPEQQIQIKPGHALMK